ncbi:MAG: SDR family oxidoreductase [Beijerinckiaceae bacterium]|jgi:NAD(P)-dependent dehydrogenase (short-subunit alcohol dehydrogenase family)|nr:SDR family oxidoreductase [Beijerinckiaceae bacterium]
MQNATRHALVTGASSGIGAAIVSRLAGDGWRVTGAARRALAAEGEGVRSIACDLSEASARAQLLEATGPVDAFVHAAGFMETGTLGGLDATALARMWDLHVAAAEHLANGLAPRMQQGGRIVLIGSRTATGSPGRSQYAATKAALVAMARSWAMELAPKGITVNVVAPAATDTPMLNDPARASVVPKLPPIGRLIRPEEVAASVAFLLSEEASAITGQVLTICGGSSL